MSHALTISLSLFPSLAPSLRPLQWSGLGPGPLREAAALQPSQIQLLPLCPGAVRPAGPAGGDREDLLRGLRGEGQSKARSSLARKRPRPP